MNFVINNINHNPNEQTLNFCENNNSCNRTICHKLIKISTTRCLGLVFSKHFKWNFHVNNIVTRLRRIKFSFKL